MARVASEISSGAILVRGWIMEIKLSERICKKYPSRVLFTATPPYSLYLSFDENFEDKSLLIDELYKMNIIPQSQSGYGAKNIFVGKTSLEGLNYYCVSGKGWKAYAIPENWHISIAWMLYTIAFGMGLEQSCSGKVISVQAYSAKQQYLAYRLKKAVARQLEGGGNIEATAQEIVKILKHTTNHLRRSFHYEARPIAPVHWEMICKSNAPLSRLFQSEQKTDLKSLSNMLFGMVNVKEELESWICYLKTQPEFTAVLTQAQTLISRQLMNSVLLADIDRVVERVRVMMGKEHDYSDPAKQTCLENVEKALRKEVSIKKIDAAALRLLYEEVSAAYNLAADKFLGSELTLILLEETTEAILEVQSKAIPKILEIGRDLDWFCQLNTTSRDDPLSLDWKALSEGVISDECLFTDVDEWTDDMFNDLTMTTTTENLVAWFLRTELCPIMEFVSAVYYLKPIQINDKGFAVSILAKPLSQEDM